MGLFSRVTPVVTSRSGVNADASHLNVLLPTSRVLPGAGGLGRQVAQLKVPPALAQFDKHRLATEKPEVSAARPEPHVAHAVVSNVKLPLAPSGLLTQQGWDDMKAGALSAPIHPVDASHMHYTLALLEKFRHDTPGDVIQYLLDSYKTNDSPDWAKRPEINTKSVTQTPPSWEEVLDRQRAFARQFADNKPSPNSRLKAASDVSDKQRAILQSHIDALHRNPAGAALMKFVDALPFDIEYRPGVPGDRFVNQSDREVDLWFGGMEVLQRDDRARIWGPELDQPFPKLPIKGLDGSDIDSDAVIVLAHELADLLKYDELISKNIFHWASQPAVTIKDINQLDPVTLKELSANAAKADEEMLLHFEAVSIQLELLVRYWSHFTEGAQPLALRFPVYNQSPTFPWKPDGSPADWRAAPTASAAPSH